MYVYCKSKEAAVLPIYASCNCECNHVGLNVVIQQQQQKTELDKIKMHLEQSLKKVLKRLFPTSKNFFLIIKNNIPGRY